MYKKITLLLLTTIPFIWLSAQINTFPYFEDFETQATCPTGCGAACATLSPWTNSTTDDLDWLVDVAGTTSGNTGPSVDHTLGTTAGKYLYIETSCSGTGYSNKVANLESPWFDFTGQPDINMSFWYHTYGATIGNLFVEGKIGINGVWLPITGPITGNEDAWKNWAGCINPAFNGMDSVQFRFNYTSGTSFTGDIGLDDISISLVNPTDVGVTAINAASGCGLSNMETIEVTICNFGDSLIPGTAIPLAYSIDGGAPIFDAYVATNGFSSFCAGTSCATFVFTTPADFSTPATYNIDAWTFLPGDAVAANDSSSFTVLSLPIFSGVPYFEDFETGQNGWVIDNTIAGSWAFGTPAKPVINSAGSGVNSFVTGGLSGIYNANEQSFVTSPCLDISGANGQEHIAAKVWWESENSWDGANIFSSIDGGTTWDQIGNFNDDLNWYNDNSISGVPNGVQQGWTGQTANNGSGQWVCVQHSLDSAMMVDNVGLRIRVGFGSDGSVQREGFAFDDVAIGYPLTNDIFPDTIEVCGPSYTLDAGSGFNFFNWSTNENTQSIDVTTTGTYSLCFGDATGMFGVEETYVNFISPLPGPALDLGADAQSCLAVDVDGTTTGATSYLWSTMEVTPMINVDSTGTYILTVSNSVGCSAIDTIDIIIDILEIDLGTDVISCDSYTIDGTFTTADSYLWSTGDTTATTFVNTSGDYSLTIIDNNGCTDTDTINVTINSANLDLGADTSNCVTYTIDGTYPGATAYMWSTMETTPMITVTTSGDYILTVTDANGCMDIDTVNITILPFDDASYSYTGFPLTVAQTYTFTTATATGNVGPTQALCDTEYTGTSLDGDVTVTGGIQFWTVPVTGTYEIQTFGGQGYGDFGGRGAHMTGEFDLIAGTTLKILVGQAAGPYLNFPAATYNHQFGGGGGSFVTDASNTPLIIAGGGGGNHGTSYLTQCDAQITTSGAAGLNATTIGAGGINGNGGLQATSADAGGGLLTDGTGTAGGDAFVNGGLGGIDEGTGGFGCGGGTSSWNNYRGGGGGGYSGGGGANNGGACCPAAGGGGSFNAGLNPVNIAGVQLGNGMVIINFNSVGNTIALCASDTNPIPTAFGPTGGTYSATPGISVNTTTGIIDLPASTPGVHTVTYTTNGTCPNSSDLIVTINAIEVDLGMNVASCDSFTIDGTTPNTASYLWSTMDTTATLKVTTSGTYFLDVVSNDGCVDSDTIVVTINNSDVNLGADVVTCDSYIINATTPNTASYLWSTTETTPSITVTTSGTYIVGVISNDGCISSDTINVTINSASLDLGPDAVSCDSYTINGTYPGATAYSWNTFEVTPFITVTSSGTYTLTVTDANGCQSTDNIQVTINSITPSLGADVTACETHTLDGSTAGAVSYLWSTGETTPMITVTNVGTFVYTLYVTDANGCQGSDDVQVTINTLNLDVTVFNIITDLYTIDGTTPNAASYLWSTGEVTPVIEVDLQDTYSLTVTDNNGCVKSVDVDLVQSFVGIEDLSETTEINLYPNPTSGEITLELSDLNDEGEVKIYNANGQLVKVKTLDSNTSIFDMKDSASGTYYMKIEINNAVEVKKFILSK